MAGVNVLFDTPDNEFWRALAQRVETVDGAAVRFRRSESGEPDEAFLRQSVAMVGFSLDVADLERLPDLKLVAVPMAGLNNLPIPELRQRGIEVVNAHANGRWVAERTVALLLGLLGKLVAGDRDLRRGVWHGFAAAEPVAEGWRSVNGMTAAILGTGSIGQWVARFLSPLGVVCRGFRRSPAAGDLPDGLFSTVSDDLHETLRGADIVIVALPLTPRTRGIIGPAECAVMRDAVVVNVGRGELLDEEALYRALVDKTIAGAAIDTWYRYPDPPGSHQQPSHFPFHELDTVLMSPHMGGYTEQATQASAREITERIVAWLSEGAPTGRGGTVDMEVEY